MNTLTVAILMVFKFMFESLSDKLSSVFDGCVRKTIIRKCVIPAREIRMALLEALYSVPMVKDFIQTVKSKPLAKIINRTIAANY